MSDIDKRAAQLRDDGNYEEFSALCDDFNVPEEIQDQFWNGMIAELTVPETQDEDSAGNMSSAVEKIDKELKDFKGGNKEKAVSSHVAKTLKSFCKNSMFGDAVLKSIKTLSDCCHEVMKGVGSSISDIEVYRRAARFYFPGAKVTFSMQIEVDGAVSDAEASDTTMPAEALRKKPSMGKAAAKVAAPAEKIQISLFD